MDFARYIYKLLFKYERILNPTFKSGLKYKFVTEKFKYTLKILNNE